MGKRTITRATVTVNNSSGTALSARQFADITRLIKRVVRDQGLGTRDRGGTRISLSFVDDKVIRGLNKRYRKIDRATDVLSFEMGEDGMLGDIVISVDCAKRNAKRFEASLNDEIKRLVVHGALHLLGYDHETGDERLKMRKAEQKYLMSSAGG